MEIIKYLEDRKIEWVKSGIRNVGAGWIGLSECPVCHNGGHHFGINIKNGSFNCWICGCKGDFIKLIREIDKCSFYKAKEIAKKYGREDFRFDNEPEKKFVKNILPKEAKTFIPDLHMKWLEGRNFNPHHIIKKYKLMACHNLGKYRFKLIVPVIINKQTVNFVAADVTGKGKSKYIFPPNADVNVQIGQCLYNFDTLKDGGEAIIVEGCTDVWRLGDRAVGLLHKRITKEQLNLLATKELERVVIIPDEGALDAAEFTANQISGIVDNCEIVQLEAGDPADLSVDEVKSLRRYIGI